MDARRTAGAGVEVPPLHALHVRDCWVVELTRSDARHGGEEEDFYEIRTEWSDKSITYLRKRNSDIVSLLNKLRKSLPEDGRKALRALMLQASFNKIKESDTNKGLNTRVGEVEKLLKTIISVSPESDAARAFFEAPARAQPARAARGSAPHQSLATAADVRRSNGFCLANTETILCDAHLSREMENSLPVCSVKWRSHVLIRAPTRCENEINVETAPLNSAEVDRRVLHHTSIKPRGSVNSLHCLQMEMLETDILE
ncbi:PX domain containing 1a [Brachyhypopomus gauderio]|uniref:PX domain containing 1a n=1 Tax=Brachyhypopomus gauderio TaxID=698409 RepID=UPI0040437DEC